MHFVSSAGLLTLVILVRDRNFTLVHNILCILCLHTGDMHCVYCICRYWLFFVAICFESVFMPDYVCRWIMILKYVYMYQSVKDLSKKWGWQGVGIASVIIKCFHLICGYFFWNREASSLQHYEVRRKHYCTSSTNAALIVHSLDFSMNWWQNKFSCWLCWRQ